MKKLQVILLLLGVVFLAVLIGRVGPGKLWHELGLLGWGLIPLILTEGVAEMIHVLGWRQCLSGPLRSLPWWLLFRIRMSGYAINFLTPTAALGGEVTKGTLLASYHRGPEAASGVLIGKLCFILAHVIFVVLGSVLVLWRVNVPAPMWRAMLISGTLITTVMILFLLLQKYGKLGGIVRWLAERQFAGKILHKVADELTEVDEALKQYYQDHSWGLTRAIAWHLLGYSIGILQAWYFFHLLHQDATIHQDATLTVAASTWFLGMWFDLFTFAVPQNVGSLEATRVFIMNLLGFRQFELVGTTYGFVLRLTMTFWSCFGLAIYGLLISGSGNGENRKNGPNPAPPNFGQNQKQELTRLKG